MLKEGCRNITVAHIAVLGIFYGRIAWRFHRYTILTITLLAFGLGLWILGFATSLVMVGLAVILVGIGDGLLMPPGKDRRF